MKKFLSLFIEFVDSIIRWSLPPLNAVSVITGAFLTYDFKKLVLLHPFWKRQAEIIENWLPLIFFISIFTALILSLFQLLYRRSYKKLKVELQKNKRKSEIIAENIKNLFDGYLYQVANKLEFGTTGINDERITIYIHNSAGAFIPFGRYSANPNYKGTGRLEYPDNEGCISKGWFNGWHFENRLGTNQNYIRINKDKYNIEQSTLNKLRMKSALFGVKRIDDVNGNMLAVIVVESTRENRYTEPQLRSVLSYEEGVISELITKLREYIPQLSYARDKGF